MCTPVHMGALVLLQQGLTARSQPDLKLIAYPRLTENCGNSPASASEVLELQAWATRPGYLGSLLIIRKLLHSWPSQLALTHYAWSEHLALVFSVC